MSPHVDLDPDVLAYLKSQAEPFVDTPSSVLRRLLGLPDPDKPTSEPIPTRNATVPEPQMVRRKKPARRRTRLRAAAGSLLPEANYERPLLEALIDAGGQAPYREVVTIVGDALREILTPADLETLNSGNIRWQNRLQFVRLRLVERGLMDKNTPRGIWGITEAGRKALDMGAIG